MTPLKRIYCEVTPALWRRFDEIIPKGSKNSVVEIIITDFVNYLERLTPDQRKLFWGAYMQKKISLQEIVPMLEEA